MPARKVALVTGAGTGVGRAVTLALMREGYAVVLAGRRKDKLEEVAKEGAPTPGDALVVPTDVADAAAIKALFAKTKDSYGRLDLLFNNAGIGAPAMPIEDLPLDKWQAVVATNLTGVFLCTQEAIKMMKAQNPRGGRIINNGSISAHTPRPRSAAYTATKHAVTGLTKQTALDCRGHDICCGQIDIGNAATPLTERMVQGEGVLQPDGTKKIEARMAAEDVGRAVVYMASLPLDTNVLFMTVMANLMPFVGRG
ncbi:MAG TPA: SDR family oxidoreductase [Xanthobacteraceae bacterium]|nr:SDR family oxidoreductase [Xanthobacteraceae bacterium]